MSGGAAYAAAAATAADAERQRQEEEEMTNYTNTDLQEDWEFKILRSNTTAFKKPHVLQIVCAEEAQAGWQLVEKFDNQRLRFKRRISERAKDASLEIDPYRTMYGWSNDVTVAIVVSCFFAFALVLMFFMMIR